MGGEIPIHDEPVQEETICTIESGVTEGFHVLTWYGIPGGDGKWVSNYPFDD
jgi:hypothetical protein